MATLKTTFLAVLATRACAQSIDPGLGSNPYAQGATDNVTRSTGPNGSEHWLNTGITSDGWNPPFMALEDLYHIPVQDFYAGIGFQCAQYDQYFQSASSDYGVDPMILAVLAMQQSTCSTDTGGLMQAFCEYYPNGTCTNSTQDNVNAGTSYFTSQIAAAGDNVIPAFGSYNGWFTANSGMNGGKGLTKDFPCSSQALANGVPQNLDYLHQVLNGWLMGLDVYGAEGWIGTYQCTQSCNDGSVC